jgi:hypothetical protein
MPGHFHSESICHSHSDHFPTYLAPDSNLLTAKLNLEASRRQQDQNLNIRRVSLRYAK